MKKPIVLFLSAFVFFWSWFAKTEIQNPISIKITKLTDLDFGVAPQNDPPKTIVPTFGSSSCASFRIIGHPHLSYHLLLPSTPVTMTVDGGGMNKTISVSDFKSFPNRGGEDKLDAEGRYIIYVGATRAALPPTQRRGNYAGSFSVTVVY